MRSDHSRERGEAGRPVQQAFNDAQLAKQSDVFCQTDGRYVVRGKKGREHIFEPGGELVTSIERPHKAHLNKIRRGERQPITIEEMEIFRELFQ
jgi:hypothetical protein